MEKQQNDYTLKDLLQNESFLRWRLLSSPEDQLFWETYLKKNPHAQTEVDKAVHVVSKIRLNDVKLSDEESFGIFQRIQHRIEQKEKKEKHSFYTFVSLSVAAVILFLLMFFPYSSTNEETMPQSIAESSETGTNQDDIQIILADQRNFTLDKDAHIEYNNDAVVMNGDKVETASHNSTDKSTQFNKIIVPHGKRSTLLLEDGTKIWINSGSTVQFPTSFTSEKREIKLEGEIYLEVAKDKIRPFFVNASDLLVKVMGTSFNISSYSDDPSSKVVLVEGKVEVSGNDEKVTLLPNQMASLNNQTLLVNNVKIQDHISWKEGYLHFTSEPLSQILKRLSRYYAKDITCDPYVENMKFTGKLVLFGEIQDVLEIITHTIPVEFEFKNQNEIFICRDNKIVNLKTHQPMKQEK